VKRSEIIKNVVNDSEGKYSENTVNEILFLLESYGIKPPTYREKSIMPGYEYFEVDKWEPESQQASQDDTNIS
jgi:hypothetical protein